MAKNISITAKGTQQSLRPPFISIIQAQGLGKKKGYNNQNYFSFLKPRNKHTFSTSSLLSPQFSFTSSRTLSLFPSLTPSLTTFSSNYSTATSNPFTATEAPIDARKFARVGNIKIDGRTLRWYKKVSVEQTIPKRAGENELFRILLDGRAVLTPGDNKLESPFKILSSAIAVEWESQDKNVKPFTMPLTTLCCTALDRIPETRHTVVGSLLQFLETDAICFRAPRNKETEELYHIQERIFVPLRNWFQETFLVPLDVVDDGSMRTPEHKEHTFQTLRWFLHDLTDWELVALDSMANLSKSLIISLASLDYKISTKDAITAARLDEDFQLERNGIIKSSHDVDVVDFNSKFYSTAFFAHVVRRENIPQLNK